MSKTNEESSSGQPRKTLAVMTTGLGGKSETFVQKHMVGLHPGGTVVFAITSRQPDYGHWDVDCPKLVFTEKLPGVLDRAAFKLGMSKVYGQMAIRRFLSHHRVDVILAEYLDLAHGWYLGTRSLGIPFFAHAHGYDISIRLRSEEWRRKYLDFAEASGIITVSSLSRNSLIELGLPSSKIHVIPCGIDVPPAAPSPTKQRDTINCLAVGRMVGKKAPLKTLSAFAEAYEKQPALRLQYIGNGPLLDKAEAFVRQRNLEEVVRFMGAKDHPEVLSAMRDSDIFLQHSIVDPESGDTEGLPVAILEAMAAGLPIVSTRHAGIPEAVADGESGVLVEEGDTVAMAAAIKKLASEANLRSDMGQAAWARARDHFSWEKERQALRDLMGLS